MSTIRAGRINRLFGTGGSVMLTLYDAFPDDFDPETEPLLVTIDALEVPLWCERFERRGTAGAVATFADLDTDRRAQELLGLEFRIAESAAADDDEFYLEDLIGFAVETEEIRSPDHTEPAGTVATDPATVPATDPTAARTSQTAPTTSGTAQPGLRIRRGILTDYYDSDINPLFELEIEGRRVLVPAVEEFIARIDFEGRTLKMVLPEGLLDL